MSKGLKPEELEQIKPMVDELYDFTQFSLQLFRDVVLGNPAYVDLILNGPYTLDVHNMGLVDENNAPNFYDGKVRVVDFEGKEICKYAPDGVRRLRGRARRALVLPQVPVPQAARLEGLRRGHRLEPLLRHAAGAAQRRRPHGDAEGPGGLRGDVRDARRPALHGAAGQPLGAARRDGAERRDAADATAPTRRSPATSSASIPQQITGEGVGIVEAMRGTLTHHYTCDENGICTSANLIVGTTNNNAPIQMVTKKVAQTLIKPGKEPDQGILNMIEMAFRAFDPCYSCATHSLPGQMPLEVRVYKGGELYREFRRNC